MRTSAIVDADHFQFIVSDTSGEDVVLADRPEGLLVDAEGLFLSIVTGTQWGDVEVAVEAYATAPPVDPTWEDVVEVSVRAQDGLFVGELMGEPALDLVEEGGDYRLRVSARGRDAGRQAFLEGDDEEEPEPVEFYLLEIWPEPLRPSERVRMTSVHGLTWGQD